TAGQISEPDQIKQFKEFLGTCNKLTENCFLDCIKGLISREVKPGEMTCSDHHLQRYLKTAQRFSMRFQGFTTFNRKKLTAKAGLLGQPQ
ncbi:TIM9 translocase, partial [Pedionomus torquatus]|nr:TIM9 translocase [Pedionomus torquatus]